MVFTQIPSTWRVPGSYTEFDLTSGYEGMQSVDRSILVLAQKTSSGTATANIPIAVESIGNSRTYFGQKSIAHIMCNNIWNINKYATIYCCPLDDGAGTQATISFSITGTSTTSGQYILKVANRTYDISSSSMSDFATQLETAIDNDEFCPFTCAYTTYTENQTHILFTLTAANDGLVDSYCRCHFTKYPTGIKVNDNGDLLGESLTNGACTSGTSWTAATDFAYGTNNFTYTHSAGSGTLTQASGALAIAGVANKYYKLTYMISGNSGTAPTVTITSAFSSSSYTLSVTSGSHCVYFLSKATTPGDFVISVTSTVAGAFTIDDISLKQCQGGDLDTLTATAGTVDPTITTALTNCVNQSAWIYAIPFSDSTLLGEIKTHIDNISDAIIQNPTRGCFGYHDLIGSESNVKTLCGTTLNYWRLHCAYFPYTDTMPFELSAQYAACISLQPRYGDPIDFFEFDAHCPSVNYRLTETQKNELIKYGVSPIVVENETSKLLIGCTTYTNTSSVDIAKLRGIETSTSLDYIRVQVKAIETTNFRNRKNNEETREQLRAMVYDLLKKLEGSDYEITQNVDDLKDGIIVEADGTDPGRCNVLIPSDIVMGLHVIANLIKLI